MKAQLSTDAVWMQLSSDLRQFIRRRVSDDHAADDLLQETFLRIHRHLETLEDAGRLAAWVYQIARNVVHDHHRKATNTAVTLSDADPPDDGNDLTQPACREAGWLSVMIASLPQSYREALLLSEIEGLTQQEVGQRLGISLSGAKSRIQRGRARLRDLLDRCCSFQFDRAGRLLDCDPRPGQATCQKCDGL